MPSNTVLDSGPAMWAAHILIWFYSCAFCLQCPQLSKLVCFLLWELLLSFYIFRIHKVCLVDRVDLICSLDNWWEGLRSSLDALPLGFNCGFISTSACGVVHSGLLLRLPWRTWVCPSEGQLWRWCSCLGHSGSGSTRYSEELADWEVEVNCDSQWRKGSWQQWLKKNIFYSYGLTCCEVSFGFFFVFFSIYFSSPTPDPHCSCQFYWHYEI